MATYDMVLRGGLIVDGSGNEPTVGDVAIKGDRIVAVGIVGERSAKEIDATGRIVTPGFVDIHTHYDGQAIWSDILSPSSAHGVTTVVMGNCGVGFAPCRREDHERLINVMEGVEDIPGVVMAEGLAWDWETFPDYLDALERRPRDIDVAVFLPHSPLRIYVMGERGAALEPANDDDLARMRELARQAIEVGALGFATSRTLLHRTADGAPIPSFDASNDELAAIALGLSDAGAGVLQAVLDVPNRNWIDEIEALRGVVRRSGRPATFTLATANTGDPEWPRILKLLEEAQAQGEMIFGQVFPRPIGMILALELSTHPFAQCPGFAAIKDLPLPEKVAALRDPELRARLLTESPVGDLPLAAMGRAWTWIFPLTDPPNYSPANEDSIAARAARAALTPLEIAYDLLLEDDGNAMLYVALGNFHDGSLKAAQEMMMHPTTVVGLGDGGAHYGAICDASYPTFMLSYWVRDHTDGIALESAVKMMTSDPARMVGLGDRGLIAPGFKADLNVIDLKRLRLHKPRLCRDLPAGGSRLDQTAEGYDLTLVSGQVIVNDDKTTTARPGRLVRGTRRGLS